MLNQPGLKKLYNKFNNNSSLLMLNFIKKLQINIKQKNIYQRQPKMSNCSYTLVIFIIILAYCIKNILAVDLFRLSTQSDQIQIMRPTDSLVSTLGNYKITLLPDICTLNIQKFSMNYMKYVNVGYYPQKSNNFSCSYIQILQGRVLSDQMFKIFNLSKQSYNHSTIFTIDDLGVIRLIGSYYKSLTPEFEQVPGDLISEQFNISIFVRDNTTFFWTGTFLDVQFFNSYGSKLNTRNWNFTVANGQLTISSAFTNLTQKYLFHALTINNSRFFDINFQKTPGQIFNNITYHPSCSIPKHHSKFHTPYTIQIDPYWPILSFYQQGKYKIIEITIANLIQAQYYSQINDTNRMYHFPYYSPCPKKTFEYLGDCVPSCPQPYFHQIRGDVGKCVLNCQEYSKIDPTMRICYCMTLYEIPFVSTSHIINNCTPTAAVEVPFGCVCFNQLFYDLTLTFDCVTRQKCPKNTFPYKGLCMECPARCQSCSKDIDLKISFLKCTSCQKGYQISFGRCVKICHSYFGIADVHNQLLNQTCVQCNEPNCMICAIDGTNCTKCNLKFSLISQTCIESFRNQAIYLPVYGGNFSFYYLPIPGNRYCIKYIKGFYQGVPYLKCDLCSYGYAYQDGCQVICPQGTLLHANRYCVCQGQFNLTIYNRCSKLPACPVKLSFDMFSFSCQACPYGCISCSYDACTSCFPGYHLFLSPQQNKCRKISPHAQCQDSYYIVNGNTCIPKNLTDIKLDLCKQTIKNCQICLYNSNQTCLRCKPPYLIYNNSCIKTCPVYLIKYQQTCILTEIKHCQIPYLLPSYQYFLVDSLTIQNSDSYQYYIDYDPTVDIAYQFAKPQNPIGYIEIFLSYINYFPSGIQRQTSIYEPYWTCLKCNDGFGLTPDRKSCILCPEACRTKKCYYAQNNSCMIKYTTQIQCPIGYIDLALKQCLTSCDSSDKYPEFINGKLHCILSENSTVWDYIRVDSASYQIGSTNQYITFIAFDNKVKNISLSKFSTSNSNQIEEKTGKRIQQATIKYHSIKSQQNINNNDQNIQLIKITQQISQSTPQIIQGQYIRIKDSSPFFYITISANELKSVSNLAFPNQVYGSTIYSSRNNYMKTWLAYIGYIMGITILLLHYIFIGLGYLYKVDNLLIFVQSIFYFLYVKLLVGRLLVQFYYGWYYAHGGFLPNLLSSFIPINYMENRAPLSYKLVSLDGNFFRNAGFSLIWMLIYYVIFIFALFFVKIVLGMICNKKQIWNKDTAEQAACAGFQFFSMNLFFFSISQLRYSGNAYQQDQIYYKKSQIIALVTIIIILIYSFIRFLYNNIGGIYMLKRIIIVLILVTAYQNSLFLIPTVALQILFIIVRLKLQKPQLTSEKSSIILQSILFIFCYMLMFLSLNVGANTIFISEIIFILIVYLAYDFIKIYLQSRNQYEQYQMAKIYAQDWQKIGFTLERIQVFQTKKSFYNHRSTNTIIKELE